jgi:hypothetical protein
MESVGTESPAKVPRTAPTRGRFPASIAPRRIRHGSPWRASNSPTSRVDKGAGSVSVTNALARAVVKSAVKKNRQNALNDFMDGWTFHATSWLPDFLPAERLKISGSSCARTSQRKCWDASVLEAQA